MNSAVLPSFDLEKPANSAPPNPDHQLKQTKPLKKETPAAFPLTSAPSEVEASSWNQAENSTPNPMKLDPNDASGSRQATDSECQIIASLLDGKDGWLRPLSEIITDPAMFTVSECRVAWTCMLALNSRSEAICVSSVVAEVKASEGRNDLRDWLFQQVGQHSISSLDTAEWHARKIQEHYKRRRTRNSFHQLEEKLLADECSIADVTAWMRREATQLEEVGSSSFLSRLRAAIITGSSLADRTIPPRPRLLDQWLCEGDLGYIFAPRGVGKTWLAMALPAAIAKGEALGMWTAGDQRARVLYVDGEMALDLAQKRVIGLGLATQDASFLHHDILFQPSGRSLNIADPAHQNSLTTLLVEGGFTCLGLDNLSCLAVGVKENDGFDYEGIAQWLLDLRRRKITVIIIHHAGRNGFMRGHSKREDACSWIIELKDARTDADEGAHFVTHFAKPSRNTQERLPDLLWHFTTGSDGMVQIQCEKASLSDYELFIQHVLEGAEAQADIAELMDKPKGTISKWAKKAASEGRIAKRGNRLLPPSNATQNGSGP